MQGLLDGFGKLNGMTISRERLCFSSRMLLSTFYNNSLAVGRFLLRGERRNSFLQFRYPFFQCDASRLRIHDCRGNALRQQPGEPGWPWNDELGKNSFYA